MSQSVTTCQMKKIPGQFQREARKISRTDPLTYVPPIPNETHLFGAKKKGKYKGALHSAMIDEITSRIQVLAKRRQEEVKMAEVCEHMMSAQCLWKGNNPWTSTEKGNRSRKSVYVIAAPGTGTDRAAQLLVVYPALKKLPWESCRDLL
jgi:hypothetical protein